MENGKPTQITWACLVVCAACVSTDHETTTSTSAQEIASADAGGPGFLCACRWECSADRGQPPLGEAWTIGECETVTTNDGEQVDSPTIGTLRATQAEAADYCNTYVYDPLRDTGRTLIALLPDVESCWPLE